MEETAQKFCRGCGRWLALREYSFKNQARGVLRSQCRACCRERSRRHHERQKPDYLKRNRRRRPLLRRRAARAVLEYLQQHPCAGCGERDPIVLEFNRLDPLTKAGNISEMIRDSVSRARLAAEIAKCEVLCANCHQRHTIAAKRAHYKVTESTRGPSWRLAANRRFAAFVLDWLRISRCVDCQLADALVLQFDHRPGEVKVKDIGWYVSSGSRLSFLSDELAKCDMQCANCHRRRTASERGWFRARAGR